MWCLVKNKNFLIFLVISFGVTVPLFYVSTLGISSAMVPVVLLAGSYVPALAAWIATARDGDEAKQAFRQRLWGIGGGTWLVKALVIPSIIWLVAFVISFLVNKDGQPVWAALAALPLIFLVNYGEEIGWRGYALPYLMERFNPFNASLVLGVIWALFHAALYWQRPVFGLLASAVIMLISVILAWMFVNTKTIIPGTLLHAVFNTWTQVFINAENEILLVVVIVLLGLVAGYLFIRYGKELTV